MVLILVYLDCSIIRRKDKITYLSTCCKSSEGFFKINIKGFLNSFFCSELFVHDVKSYSLHTNFSSSSKKKKERKTIILWSEYYKK